MNTELKSCPFCGSTDISEGEVLTEYPNGKTTTQSMCNNCKALGAEATLSQDEIDYGNAKAIVAWNRRVAQPVSAGLTDEQIAEIWAENTVSGNLETGSSVHRFAHALLSAAQRDSAPASDEDKCPRCGHPDFMRCGCSPAFQLQAALQDSQPVADASADARDAAILRAGAVLSNIAFNMAQRRLGELLTGDDARALYNARNQWDAAIAASREVE
jgi:Lar family restriction alleviation protein